MGMTNFAVRFCLFQGGGLAIPPLPPNVVYVNTEIYNNDYRRRRERRRRERRVCAFYAVRELTKGLSFIVEERGRSGRGTNGKTWGGERPDIGRVTQY